MSSPISFRNVVRYVQDLDANAKMYEALGFKNEGKRGDMVVLKNEEGLTLLLHQWEQRPSTTTWLDTSIGFTIKDSVEEARKYVEEAGFKILRLPAHGDNGFFFIYGDLDGNPINLVGHHLMKKH